MWMEKNQCCQSGSALLQASNVVQTNMLIYATLHLYEQSLFSERIAASAFAPKATLAVAPVVCTSSSQHQKAQNQAKVDRNDSMQTSMSVPYLILSVTDAPLHHLSFQFQ